MVEMTWNTMDVIMLAIFCEAIVELWRKAAPLQPLRRWLVRITPFLYSEEQTVHMLDCPSCTATHVAFACGILYFFVDIVFVRWIVIALVILRLSNWLHLIFSTIRDIQIDRRIRR
jgi:hypothetical protein